MWVCVGGVNEFDKPFSRNLNSIEPDSGLLDPSRTILGLKGP